MSCKGQKMGDKTEIGIVKNTTVKPKKKEYKLRMVGGLDFHEVSVAFRKVLKGSHTYEACFWDFVLLESGSHKHIWKHLAVYASQLGSDEVIGVSALRNSFDLNTTAKDRKTEEGFCYICRAVIDLCQSDDDVAETMKQVIDNYCSRNWLELT